MYSFWAQGCSRVCVYPLSENDFVSCQRVWCVRFFVGNNGNYDYFAQCALRDVFQNGEKIRYSIVLSHLYERALSGEQKATVFPEGLECVPPKFAISKRNLWLVKNAEYAIVYVENKISNCGKLLQKALARGIQIINIADFDIKNEDWAIL